MKGKGRKEMNIVGWNIKGFDRKKREARAYMRTFDIIGVTESWRETTRKARGYWIAENCNWWEKRQKGVRKKGRAKIELLL